MSLKEAKQFVAHFITGEYTPEEYATFLRWLRGATNEELNEIADEHEALHERWSITSAVPSSEWISRLEEKLDHLEREEPLFEPMVEKTPVRLLGRKRLAGRKAWMAAASVIVLVSAGAIWFTKSLTNTSAGKAGEERRRLEALSKSYSNPRGGDIKELVLADGSKVWLNAASTLKYADVFKGHERVVELSGEAFFDVVKNSEMPFRVLMKDAEVEVLGTNFNVTAYEDEPISRTTLIEGAVKIESGSSSVTLKPGQQAEVPYPSPGVAARIKVIDGVDPEAVLGWKNGVFQYSNADLRIVRRELGRAYNVDIQYDAGAPDKRITGIFSRKDGLDKILEQLGSLNIHFRNDGKTVTVIP